MKHIAIIGSTGATGKELVKLALESNYQVTVIVRSPDAIAPQANVRVVQGDVTDVESLTTALENIDVVISCFGPSHHRKVGTLMSQGAINIVKACEKNGVQRLVFMSGFVQADYDELSLFTKLAMPLFRVIYHQSYKDKIIAEAAIQNSALNWVIVRAAGLNHSQPIGTYKAGVKSKIHFTLMSYTDCAQCLLDAIEDNHWTRQIINVGKAG